MYNGNLKLPAFGPRPFYQSMMKNNLKILLTHINLNWRHLSFYFMIIKGNPIILLA